MAKKIYVKFFMRSILGDEELWVGTRRNDETVLAACMYLALRGQAEEAELLLERYCESKKR